MNKGATKGNFGSNFIKFNFNAATRISAIPRSEIIKVLVKKYLGICFFLRRGMVRARGKIPIKGLSKL